MVKQASNNNINNKNEHVFRDMPVTRALWSFAFPSIISQLVLLAYNLADTYFLGRVGNPYMVAAVSLVLPVYNICIAFANLLGTGGGTLIARLLGRQNPNEAKKVSGLCVALSLICSGFFAICISRFQEPILYFLGASENTAVYAKQYTTWVVIAGAIPSVLALTLANLSRNAGLSKEAGLGTSCAGLLNIALDPLFMFVILPPGMEVIGAAIATLISNCCNVIYFIIIFRINKRTSVLRLLPLEGLPTTGSLREIFAVGIPSALTTFLYDVTHVVIDKLTATHGDIPLAAIGIVLKAERLPLNICVGLCMGMVPLVGYNYAAGNFKRMKKIHRTAQMHGFLISAICICLYEAFAGTIMELFISDSSTAVLGTSYLRVRCLATIAMFACFNYTFFFQGIGLGKYSLIIATLRQLVFNVPILILFNSLFGMTGIIWTQLTADSCTSLLAFILYRRVAKRTWAGNSQLQGNLTHNDAKNGGTST